MGKKLKKKDILSIELDITTKVSLASLVDETRYLDEDETLALISAIEMKREDWGFTLRVLEIFLKEFHNAFKDEEDYVFNSIIQEYESLLAKYSMAASV